MRMTLHMRIRIHMPTAPTTPTHPRARSGPATSIARHKLLHIRIRRCSRFVILIIPVPIRDLLAGPGVVMIKVEHPSWVGPARLVARELCTGEGRERRGWDGGWVC